MDIVGDIHGFLDSTALNTSEHQYCLYSVTQLTTYYLQRHHYSDRLEDVRNFALRFACVLQDNRLIVAPFAAAVDEVTTTLAKRKLVLLAARTAIDAAVAHAADVAEPIDPKVVVDVMNLLMSQDRVRDLRSLRLVCTLTMRRSLPVSSYPLKELPTGVIEAFVAGSGSWHVSFRCLLRAVDLHAEAAMSVDDDL
jgi:hypothetical protein